MMMIPVPPTSRLIAATAPVLVEDPLEGARSLFANASFLF
jgi:hypothetical protein